MMTAMQQQPNGAQQKTRMYQFKLVLLGESAVGKSSLVLRFVKGQFHEYQESTIGGKQRPYVLTALTLISIIVTVYFYLTSILMPKGIK